MAYQRKRIKAYSERWIGGRDACSRQSSQQQITKSMTIWSYIVWKNLTAGRANQPRSITNVWVNCIQQLITDTHQQYNKSGNHPFSHLQVFCKVLNSHQEGMSLWSHAVCSRLHAIDAMHRLVYLSVAYVPLNPHLLLPSMEKKFNWLAHLQDQNLRLEWISS